MIVKFFYSNTLISFEEDTIKIFPQFFHTYLHF